MYSFPDFIQIKFYLIFLSFLTKYASNISRTTLDIFPHSNALNQFIYFYLLQGITLCTIDECPRDSGDRLMLSLSFKLTKNKLYHTLINGRHTCSIEVTADCHKFVVGWRYTYTYTLKNQLRCRAVTGKCVPTCISYKILHFLKQ